MLKTRTYPRLVRFLHDPRLRTLVALQLVLSAVGVVLPPRSVLVTLDNPRTCDLLGHSDNSALDGRLPGVLVSPSDNPSRCDCAVHSCSILPSGIIPGGTVHTSRMGSLPGQSRSRVVHPGAAWHPDSGRPGLSSLLLKPCFLFSGLLDQFMDITVIPHIAAVPQFYPHSLEEPAD